MGGKKKEELSERNDKALEKGLPNLIKHIENMKNVYGLNVVVAVNRFFSDSEEEIKIVERACEKLGVKAVCCECFARGGAGGEELARAVLELADKEHGKLKFAYELNGGIREKITAVATKIYGASGVKFLPAAEKRITEYETKAAGLPVCIAKTQYSLSDNPALVGRPENFTVTVRDLYYRAGAGFVVALAGDIFLMPGLPKQPNAEKMTIDENGIIDGLF